MVWTWGEAGRQANAGLVKDLHEQDGQRLVQFGRVPIALEPRWTLCSPGEGVWPEPVIGRRHTRAPDRGIVSAAPPPNCVIGRPH